jgi:cytochrome c oxidase assembly protein subunit 15
MTPEPTTDERSGLLTRLWRRLPDRIGRGTRVLVWLVLISNIVIVGTGGLVRLTGSGMGCETWPYCTAESLVATQDLGIHGFIEFGNRTLTGVLVVIALLAFLAVVRVPRRDLRGLAFANGIGIILQAVIGGVIVWLHLPPTLVGIHFVISAALVANAAALVSRTSSAAGPRRRAVGTAFAALAWITAASVIVTVLIGILLTGSGPHAGDDEAARNGLDPVVWQHIHSWPAYVTFGLTVLLFVASWRTPRLLRLRFWVGLVLAVEVLQIVVGLWQARTGLPIALVNIHMVLAVVLVAAMTTVIMNLTTVTTTAAIDDPQPAKRAPATAPYAAR